MTTDWRPRLYLEKRRGFLVLFDRTAINIEDVLRASGWRPVYARPHAEQTLWLPRTLAWWARPLLRWRDQIVWAWGRHLFDLGMIREGDRIPWPAWLQWGW